MLSQHINRRHFFNDISRAAGIATFPYLIPSSALGRANTVAPGNRITVGCIGVGRMGLGDIDEILKINGFQIIAVCDVDSHRMEYAKNLVNEYYSKKNDVAYKGCAAYADYRDLIAQKDIDAVSIVTPDHWHALPTIEAAKAGKDIFLQKPFSLTIEEGRIMSDTLHRHGCVFQVGSQQRSDANFRKACELVRNGRIGELRTVRVGFGKDISCGPTEAMSVPENLDYEMWLGPAPWAPYTELRVHPQNDYSRPGWLRIKDYGAGMITGWGSHHLDITQWGMGAEFTGPVEIVGEAEFAKEGIWDVHLGFRIEYTYANGVRVICADNEKIRDGVLFEGTEGWVYVTRGAVDAQPKSLLTSEIGPDETHLYKSDDHKRNFLECIKSRSLTVAPVEIAHRSCTVCLIGAIAMELGRKVRWDPVNEQFLNDPEANTMKSRQMRHPWRL